MAGLLEKDIRLLLHLKQALVIFPVIAIFMAASNNGISVMCYLTVMIAILSITTASYDEMDNGYAFIMSMPVDSRMYVREKYLFCNGISLTVWAFSVILYTVVGLVKGTQNIIADDIIMEIVLIPVVVIMISVMLPIQLKFGLEKSRVAIFGFFGIVAGLVFLVARAVKASGADIDKLINKIMGLSDKMIMAALFVVTAVIVIISYKCSVAIMKKKEYNCRVMRVCNVSKSDWLWNRKCC